MKSLLSITAAALISAALFTASSSTASAAYCSYGAVDNAGHHFTEGAYHRKKKSIACKRARRQCNRILERKQRKGKFGRSVGCREVKEVQG